MMKTPCSLLLLLFCFCATIAKAELPVAEIKREEPVQFATEVYPFLKANCLACHNSTKAKADLNLESPQDMLKGGDTGPAIEPGNSEYSLLFTTAAHIEEPTMPPANNKSKAKNLTPEQLGLLKRWIEEGAKGDVVSTAAPESWTYLSGPQPIYTAALTKDGRFAAAGRGQKVDLYDIRLGKLVASLTDPSLEKPAAHRDLVQAVAFSPDGTIATGGYRTVKIWQRSEASAGAAITLPSDPSSLTVSPDGKRVAIGGADGSIQLLDISKPDSTPVTVKDHAGKVEALAFNTDGAQLYSVSADKTVKRRSLGDPTKSVSLPLPSAANSLALIDGGKHLVLGFADQVIRICNADLTSTFPVPAPKPSPEPEAKKPNPPADKTKEVPAAKPKPETKPAPTPKPAPAKPSGEKSKTAATPPAPKKEEAKKPAPTPPKPAPAPPKPQKLVQFKFHGQPVIAVATANPAGNEFFVGHADGTVIHCKFDPAKPTAAPAQIRRISHGGALKHMAVSLKTPGGARLATSGNNGTTKLWNIADGNLVAELKANPATQPKVDAFTRQSSVATRLKGYWDKKGPEEEKLWKAEEEKAKAAGETIAKARRDVVAKQKDLEAIQTKTPEAKPEEIEAAQKAYDEAKRTLGGAIRNRELSARLAGEGYGRQIAAQSSAAEAEALVAALKAESEALQKAENEAAAKLTLQSLSFSSDGSQLAQAVGENTIRLWSATDGKWLEDVPAMDGIQSLAFSSGNKILTVGKAKNMLVWTLPGQQWTLAKTLGDGKAADPFVDRVPALAFSPDGNRLVTGTGVPSRNGILVTWDTKTWEPIATNDEAHDDAITAVSFSPDGSKLATASTDQKVKVFETDSLTYVQTFEGHTSHVLDVTWNEDDLTIASSGADLQVKVWDLTAGQEKSKVEGFDKEVSSVSYVGGTETLLTASGDKTLKLSTAALPNTGDTFLHTADVSEDGKLIIAGGQDSVLRLWDATAKKLIGEFPSPEANDGKVASE